MWGEKIRELGGGSRQKSILRAKAKGARADESEVSRRTQVNF